MNRYALYMLINILLINFAWSIISLGENQDWDDNLSLRDPFIPLIDRKGEFRRDFKKPVEKIAPQVNLMGISKVGNTFYALIDGELLKEGQVFKEMKIEKIYADRVIVLYGDTIFELKWEQEKGNENK